MPRESTGQVNPFEMVLDQIKDLTDETKGHGKMLAGTMIKLDTLAEKSTKIESALEKVANAELSCPARLNDNRTQRRISKLEALRNLDRTGEFSVIQPASIPESQKENSNAVITFFVKNWWKILPWVLLALIGLLRILQDGDLPTEMVKLPMVEKAQGVEE